MADEVAWPIDQCEGCQAEIIWAVTDRGQWMPVDRAKIRGGNVFLHPGVDSRSPRARVLSVQQRANRGDPDLWVSHFATCPYAQRYRMPRQGSRGAEGRMPR
jgi:hypothetical protein